ncbi:MAG: thiamine diphosphokinase [Clostridium sp.]|nr:thiamine diphosphokinase [Bacteroides sp.]MCM1197835.1 thiamine diphosphokinase [Clostridium sp.]
MGKSAVIIGDGQFPKKEYPIYLIRQADYIVCCDGALRKFLRHSKGIFGDIRNPDVVIGDIDSIPQSLKSSYKGLVISVAEQETNDQTKAFNYVVDNFRDVSEIHFIGATGLREDHTIGNISLLMEYARERDLDRMGLSIDMVSDYSTIFPVTDTVELQCGTGRKISILSPDNSLRISSDGLVWPTDNVKFDNWWPATLNKAEKDTVTLRFSHKSIAIIILN